MSNFNFFMPNDYWKITAWIAAMCGICAILDAASGQYKDALLWMCLTISHFELAIYERKDR